MKLYNTNVLLVDVETTGFSATKDEIIQIAGIIVQPDWTEVTAFERKLKFNNWGARGLEYNSFDARVWIKEQVEARTGMADFLQWLRDNYGEEIPFMAYNAPFDRRFIDATLKRMGLPYEFGQQLDALKWVKKAHKQGKFESENNKLETVASVFGIEYDAHDALADVRATKDVLVKVMELYQ